MSRSSDVRARFATLCSYPVAASYTSAQVASGNAICEVTSIDPADVASARLGKTSKCACGHRPS